MKKFLASLGAFCLLTSTMTGVGAYAEMGECTLGDVNMDGTVNAIDLIITKKECLGLQEVTNNRLTLGDFNGDEIIDARDLLQLKRVLLGMDKTPEQVFKVNPTFSEGERVIGNDFLEWESNSDKSINARYFMEDCTFYANLEPKFNERNGGVEVKAAPESEDVLGWFEYKKDDNDEYAHCGVGNGPKELAIDGGGMYYYNRDTEMSMSLREDSDEYPSFVIFDGLEEKGIYTGYQGLEVNEEDGSYSIDKTCYEPNDEYRSYGVHCDGNTVDNNLVLMADTSILGEEKYAGVTFTPYNENECKFRLNDFHFSLVKNDDKSTLEFRVYCVSECEEEESVCHIFYETTTLDDVIDVDDLDYLKNGYGFSPFRDDDGNVGVKLYKGLRDNVTILFNPKLTEVVSATIVTSPEEGVVSTVSYEREVLDDISVEIHVENYVTDFMEDWNLNFPTVTDSRFAGPSVRDDCKIGDFRARISVNGDVVRTDAIDGDNNYITFQKIGDRKIMFADDVCFELNSEKSTALMQLDETDKTYKIQLPEDPNVITAGITDDSTREDMFSYEFSYNRLT